MKGENALIEGTETRKLPCVIAQVGACTRNHALGVVRDLSVVSESCAHFMFCLNCGFRLHLVFDAISEP